MLRASFQNIQATIIENIQNANEDIRIAIAWFTNKEIHGELIEKIDIGVKCIILVSDDILNKRLNLQSLEKHGGEIKIIPTAETKFLHEKFAIFDNRILIAGSYNYTKKAEYDNYESVIITDDSTLIQQYNIRFKNIYNSAKQFEDRILISKESAGISAEESILENREQDLKEELLQSLSECKKFE
jgi:phosphatidylserine/phosphatidylglycerophosphate/cardiolipin synthase-like enzyme